jgi:VWFA-related protein
MNRLIMLAFWVAIGHGMAAAQNAGPAQDEKEFTLSADVQLVLLDVSVRDRQGGFVSGLQKDDFKIFENGKPQTITQFSNSDQPVTIGLVVDNSGSMAPKRPDVITSALVFVGASNPADEIFVINFNDKVVKGLPDTLLFSDDVRQLRAALWRGPSEGRTALYDAILDSLHILDMGRQAKKTLIVISDGGDNISKHSFRDVMDSVLESRATIYTVGIFDTDDPDRNPDVLKKLANVSGGVPYFPEKSKDVVDICRQIAKDVRSRYTVAYVPHDLEKPGVRHIKIEAISPDRGKLTARTRTSYLVPTVQAAARDKK